MVHLRVIMRWLAATFADHTLWPKMSGKKFVIDRKKHIEMDIFWNLLWNMYLIVSLYPASPTKIPKGLNSVIQAELRLRRVCRGLWHPCGDFHWENSVHPPFFKGSTFKKTTEASRWMWMFFFKWYEESWYIKLCCDVRDFHGVKRDHVVMFWMFL